MKLLVSDYYEHDKYVYENLDIVTSFESVVQRLYENKKGISYRDIESLEDNHSCDFIGLKLVDVPLIISYGVL